MLSFLNGTEGSIYHSKVFSLLLCTIPVLFICLFVSLKTYRTVSGDKERFNDRIIEIASRPKQGLQAAEPVGK